MKKWILILALLFSPTVFSASSIHSAVASHPVSTRDHTNGSPKLSIDIEICNAYENETKRIDCLTELKEAYALCNDRMEWARNLSGVALFLFIFGFLYMSYRVLKEI
jgi:hypothetical protein